jgi:hypothetical protein
VTSFAQNWVVKPHSGAPVVWVWLNVSEAFNSWRGNQPFYGQNQLVSCKCALIPSYQFISWRLGFLRNPWTLPGSHLVRKCPSEFNGFTYPTSKNHGCNLPTAGYQHKPERRAEGSAYGPSLFLFCSKCVDARRTIKSRNRYIWDFSPIVSIHCSFAKRSKWDMFASTVLPK